MTQSLASEQQRIRSRCFHPTGNFVAFTTADIEQSIPDRFEQIVRRDPDHLAVATAEVELTYDQLNRLANRLARAILRRGEGTAGPVALLFNDDASVIVALLGVLKAGTFFVLLDPTVPTSRLRHILRDSGASLLVADGKSLPLAGEVAERCDLVDFDEIEADLSDENLGRIIAPEAVAAIVYTSGSTGEPKGVIQTHRCYLHAMKGDHNRMHLCPEDRAPIFGSFFTGAGVTSTMRLLTGISIHRFYIREQGLSSLASWLTTQRITTLVMGVSIFRAFVATLRGNEEFPDVRMLRLTSDRLSIQEVDAYKKHFPDSCILVHSLSSSETHRLTNFFMEKSTFISGGIVPVGYPAEDQNLVLLDDDAEEVRAGEVGEIAVRSRYLSPGYWHMPELTRAKFFPDPHGSDEVLYRTGDLGRMSEDGCLTHLGRKDLRVRIRGFSVEVVEIESALREHRSVRDVGVTAAEDGSGERRLIAYVVPGDSAPTGERLRGFLKETLPDYMIPAHFEIVAAIPLNAAGKIDRQHLGNVEGNAVGETRDRSPLERATLLNQLPEPDWTARTADAPYLAPRNDLEAEVVQIWSDVLSVTPIGVLDNFFEVGGHSLTGARMISRVLDVFQVQLSIREFFEAPTVADIAQQLRKARSASQGALAPVIVPTARDGALPVSYAQERLWFLDQLEPNNPFYNLPSTLELEGLLEPSVLEASLREIVRRHETLRTTFSLVAEGPVQVVHPEGRASVVRADLQELGPRVKDKEVERLVQEEAHQPFDLSRGPLFRVRLLQTGIREHVLSYNLHHIVSDGWSAGNLMRELGSLMEAFGRGLPSPLDALPVQYADFAAWERGWIQGDVLEQQLVYWRQHLAGAPALLELPTDRPRPKVETFRGERCPWKLPVELSGRVQELSRHQGTTVFMTLFAAFNVLLYRLSGQGDLVVGMVSAHRTRPEVDGLIGFFVNVLPIRTGVGEANTFEQLLRVVRRNCLAGYEHQDVPFEKIVLDQQPVRDLSHAPVFQVVFDMANPVHPVDLPGLRVQRRPRRLSAAKYDLVFHAAEGREGIRISLDYSTDLFDAARVEAMLCQMEVLLEQIVEDPGRGIEAYSLVDGKSEGLLPDPCARLGDGFEGAVHTLFSEQANRVPERVAVADGGDVWTYEELERRSNQLAHYLLGEGVAKGDLVAILGQRSASLVWALMGVLKAGAMFTILDPSHPVARQREVVRLAEPRAWVEFAEGGESGEELAEVWEGIECRVVLPGLSLAREQDLFEGYGTKAPGVGVGAEDLAYVAFTSGSTGEPKGVLSRHGSITHFLPWQRERFGLDETDRFILTSGLTFSHLHRDVFTPLTMGGRLHVPSEGEVMDVARLWEVIEREGVTVLAMTPARGRLLAEASMGRVLDKVRYVHFSGDALLWQDVGKIREVVPEAVVVGVYGATETQRAVSHFVVPKKVPEGKDVTLAVPLGRGVKDVQVLVLNGGMGLAGVGELGGLYVRSPHLAAGYLGDRELTEERFITNPFTGAAEDRLYWTGEMARYLPDGQVQFVRRGEDRVNVRGYRIELGEIEGVLRRHAGVRDAAVVAREFGEEGAGDERLVAYVVAADEKGREEEDEQFASQNPASEIQSPNFSAGELREYVRTQLPEYMVPGYVEFVEGIPLTGSGKVDRGALPKLDWRRPELGREYVEPQTETEEVVAAIWVALLHLDRVGIHDNFFELGGHSLLATQVMQRMRNAVAVEVPLRSLFESPTVAELAELIDTMRWAGRTEEDASDQSTEEETF